jgi:hypothetical protein
MKISFRIAVLCLFAVLLVELWIIGSAKQSETAVEHARGLGMTVDQIEKFRADLTSKAIAQDSKGMADVLLPVVTDLCKRLPKGHRDRPGICVLED